MLPYAELQVYSNYSFLRGASSPEELILTAVKYKYKAIALTDYNSISGLVRAHVIAKKHDIQFIPAARIDLKDGPSFLYYPINRRGYSQLIKLLSVGKLRSKKGEFTLFFNDVLEHLNLRNSEDQIIVIITPIFFDNFFKKNLCKFRNNIKKNLYLSVSFKYIGENLERIDYINQIAKEFNIKPVANNNVYAHSPLRRPLQDILTCMRLV